MHWSHFFTWFWRIWLLEFAIIEGIAVYHEIVNHKGDDWTFTHFIAVTIPLGMRVALIAWLAFHFLVEHRNF